MHTLHLTSFDPARYWEVVRGVRQALFHLRGDVRGRKLLREAREHVDAFKGAEGVPQLLGENADLEQVNKALTQLESNGAGGVIDLDPESIENPPARTEAAPPPPEESEQYFSDQEYCTALALLAFAEGNPTKAAVFSNTLARAAEEPEFFGGVTNVILSVFPMESGPPVVVVR